MSIKVGIVGFDTSHVVEFTKRLNHVDIEQEQCVDGARVVAGLVVEPEPARAEDMKKYIPKAQEMGVQIVDSANELIKQVDAILLECVDGNVHLREIQPFLGKGKPIFIDKPLAGNVDDAARIAELAAESDTPIFSASAVRFAPEISEFAANENEHGGIISAACFGPSKAMENSSMPPLIFYGIHAAETLFALMGRGCDKVSCASTQTADAATGAWSDGRTGVVLGTRESKSFMGFTAFCKNSVVTRNLDMSRIYTELLKNVVEFFKTGRSPVPVEESVETIAFLSAAVQSAAQGGAEVSI